jgi:hypothetical protein
LPYGRGKRSKIFEPGCGAIHRCLAHIGKLSVQDNFCENTALKLNVQAKKCRLYLD